ncbi:hypothetical protein GQ464_001210 [Rhodocaloribacter litoris]|uniref:hypothetical protein n=1 Tax=Rhodocaloribacter litoris TaxID=2558931 RepID=UPI00141DCC9D|nr:hypothetical protein [Rhodocaloribacter litoris]QXD15591.1 hypothetical protein GQ464_001210 [Rhodocaloribacter litoris]
MIDRLRNWRERRLVRRVTPAAARERAARGAAYLDAVDPGWYRRLEPDTLALADGSCCVLGQLHGEFRRGLVRAGLLDLSSAPRANLSPVRFGFHCVPFGDEALRARDYAYLDRAWREEIRRRRQAGEGAPPASAGDAPDGDTVPEEDVALRPVPAPP